MNEPLKTPRQFRLITLIGVVTIAAIVVRLSLAFPSQVISVVVFAVIAPALLWLVSAISDAISAFGRVAFQAIRMRPWLDKDRVTSPWHTRLWIALRYGDSKLPYPVPPSWIVALVTTTLTVFAWRPIRLLGQFFSGIPTFYATESFPSYLSNSWRSSMWMDPSVWSMNAWWEAGSLAHWWLHFAILGILGTSAIAIRGGDWKFKERFQRFLLFAPWLMLLDMMLLFASWMLKPTTVPEPSTGFVVGIFRWELWHWGCWLDRFWLLRASFPCMLVTATFFRRIFEVPWPLALLGGILAIPFSILGCIAWTVLFRDAAIWLGL